MCRVCTIVQPFPKSLEEDIERKALLETIHALYTHTRLRPVGSKAKRSLTVSPRQSNAEPR